MATYRARQRDPLLDSKTQAMLERRGRELFGITLIMLGLLCALILATYSPNDPGWFSITDEPAQNALGRLGASIASPLILIVGLGGWSVVAFLGIWGGRFLMHYGSERAIPRAIFAPIAIALASVYASTHIPFSGWGHSFGLGGLFGDTILGAVLGVFPVSMAIGLKTMSVLAAISALALGGFAAGVTKAELYRFGYFLIYGVVMLYVAVLSLFKGAGRSSFRLAVAANKRHRENKARKLEMAEQVAEEKAADNVRMREAPLVSRPLNSETNAASAGGLRAEPSITAPRFDEADEHVQKTKSGLFSKMPSLLGRKQEKPAEDGPQLYAADDFGDPAIKAKIAEVIRNRSGAEAPGVTDEERDLIAKAAARHRRGPDPMILQTEPAAVNDPVEDAQRFDSLEVVDELDDEVEPALVLHRDESADALRAHYPEPKKVVQHAPKKAVQPSRKAQAEAQPKLNFDEKARDFETPPLSLLTNPIAIDRHHLSDEALEENARMLENVLDDYGVKGEIVSVRPGPVVTMYELEPAPGLKASRVIGLADDIARSMSALSARVSTVPGRSVIGIELPNETREKVVLREILSARDFGDTNMRLPLALGKDIGGDPIVANLAKMPHLLIAGTTGSGKSVAINTMILSLLYKLTPEECRLIMIDPKMLELSVYDGIPHLLSPVVTDPKKAVVALKWVVGEMEERYRKMSKMGVRNIEGFNGRVADALSKGEMFSRTVQTGFDDETGDPVFETEEFQPEKLPYIVVIVDEMADLMMVAGKEIEACIQRLAQMARASGIHLIMATQRPSVDVITGTIKANFPTRISFQVTSKVDSRTILGEQGAEQLLGMGDMLYMAGGAKIIRVHGPFVSDEEVEEIVNHLKAYGPPEYVGGVVDGPDDEASSDIDLVLGLGGNTEGEDALYDQAVQIVIRDRKCSTSYIQRKLAIGYNKAARLVEQMEDQGLVSAANHVGKREILVPEQA